MPSVFLIQWNNESKYPVYVSYVIELVIVFEIQLFADFIYLTRASNNLM
jgi:hypothetical protein